MISISPTQNVGSEKPRIEPAMMVLPANRVGLQPRPQAERHAEHDRDQHGRERELERRRHALEDQLQRRHVEDERLAEVAERAPA